MTRICSERPITLLGLLALASVWGMVKMCTSLPNCCTDCGELLNATLEEPLNTAEEVSNISQHCEQLRVNPSACQVLLTQINSFWNKYHSLLSRQGLSGNVEVNLPTVKARVQNVSTDLSRDLLFTIAHAEVPQDRMRSAIPNGMNTLKLPSELFLRLRPRKSSVNVAVVILSTERGLFQDGDSANRILNSTTIGVSVDNETITGLSPPLELTFHHVERPPDVIHECVYWDSSTGSTGRWNSTGCHTSLMDNKVICRCDHLTFFAVLLKSLPDSSILEALIAISYVGCSISTVFSALTIILYFSLRFLYGKLKSDDSAKIHVNVSGSLLLLNMAFLVNRSIFSMRHDGMCRAIGGFTHYSLLCSFTWIGIEGFNLYLLVIKVFNIYIRRYLLKLCVLGWGLPAVVVIIAGSINSYGDYAIVDQGSQRTPSFCWIKNTHLIYLNIVYISVIFIFNSVVLCIVSWKIFHLQRAKAGQGHRRQTWKGILTVVGLSSLVGMTWGLALLTNGPLVVWIFYLFTIMNTLQGLFIFIWFAILYYPGKTFHIKSDKTGMTDSGIPNPCSTGQQSCSVDPHTMVEKTSKNPSPTYS